MRSDSPDARRPGTRRSVCWAFSHSLGLASAHESVSAAQVLERFDPHTVHLAEWVVSASLPGET